MKCGIHTLYKIVNVQFWKGEGMADFVADAGDERLDVQLSWTRFLARSVCTFEAASSLSQRRSLAESRMLYVVKVVPFASAGLRERRERILENKSWRGERTY